MKTTVLSQFKRSILSVAMTSLMGLSSSSDAAVTIYADGFNRSGGLNGSSPDTTLGSYGGTAGATWTASETAPAIATTGTDAVFYASRLAYLPFVPQTGQIYTLTIHADFLGDWGGFGFANNPPTDQNMNTIGNDKIWVLYQNDKATTMTGGASSATGSSGYNTISLVLDTTGASWTAQGVFNGTAYGTPVTLASHNYNAIAISGAYSGTNMNVDSFSLTTSIPEPAAALLGSLGMLILLRRRRGS